MPVIAPGYYFLSDLLTLFPPKLSKEDIIARIQEMRLTEEFSQDNKTDAKSLWGDLLEQGIFAFIIEDKEAKTIAIYQQ